MRVGYHPQFSSDINHFASQYEAISTRLKERFRAEVDVAINKIQQAPSHAGHFVNTGSTVIREARRRNLASFPFFVLYSVNPNLLLFGAIIPSASDPLTWLERLKVEGEQAQPEVK